LLCRLYYCSWKTGSHMCTGGWGTLWIGRPTLCRWIRTQLDHIQYSGTYIMCTYISHIWLTYYRSYVVLIILFPYGCLIDFQGYGSTYPALGNENENPNNCMFITLICSLEAFIGVLYSGFCGAILFGKVLRIQSHGKNLLG
jgi:hypothetical protein